MELVDSLERWADSARALFEWFDRTAELQFASRDVHLPITSSCFASIVGQPLWEWGDIDRAFSKVGTTIDVLCEYFLGGDRDFAVRWTVLAFLYDLSQEQPDDDADSGFPGRDEADCARFRDELRELACRPEVESLATPQRVRWEIHNACLVSEFQRAEKLFVRLLEIDPANEARNHAHLALVQLLRALSAPPDDVALGAVRFISPWTVEATRLARWGLAVDDPHGVENQMSLQEARHWFEKAGRGGFSFPAHVKVAFGRCLFIDENSPQAARLFLDALGSGGLGLEGEQAECNEELNAALHLAAARSQERAGDPEGAKATLSKCLEAFPKYGPAYRRLADLYITIDADFQRAYEVLCRLADVDPEAKEDIYLRTLQGIAGVRGEQDIGRLLDEFFDAHPQRLRWVESAVGTHWPSLGRLSDRAKKQWLYGSWILWWRPPATGFEAVEHAVGAAFFARALEIELQQRVFTVFVRGIADLHALKKGLERDRTLNARGKKAWEDLLDGKGTFGQMLVEVDPGRDSDLAVSTRFREWLKGQFPRLADGFVREETERIRDVRGTSTHTGEEERVRAEEVCGLCRKYLEYLLGPVQITSQDQP